MIAEHFVRLFITTSIKNQLLIILALINVPTCYSKKQCAVLSSNVTKKHLITFVTKPAYYTVVYVLIAEK